MDDVTLMEGVDAAEGLSHHVPYLFLLNPGDVSFLFCNEFLNGRVST